MKDIIAIGKSIYDLRNSREKRRYFIFLMRALLHRSDIKALLAFFTMDSLRGQLLKKNPFPIEQATRAFFFHKSTFAERKKLVMEHYRLLQEKFTPETVLTIGCCEGKSIRLWERAYEDDFLRGELLFEPGQRKEGCLSLELNLGKEHIYQVMFWLGIDREGQEALWIGALQGPNMQEAREIVKKMTKWSHGYRTKNLIIYMLQCIARGLGLSRIYAVSNEGYYANNHMRIDRKLKTDFGDFWQELGGFLTEDKRFFQLPLVEKRKTMEEVPTRKRAVYRKRFEFLDEVASELDLALKGFCIGKTGGDRQ